MKRLLSALLVAFSCIVTCAAQAQVSTDGPVTPPHPVSHGKPTELSMKRSGSTSIDLRNLPPGQVSKHERIEPEPPEITPIELPGSVPPPRFPITGPSAPAPSPSASFLGLDFANWGAGHPPDTNGDVGPTYIVETVNTSIGIYDKSTGTRVAAFTFNALMSQGSFGNLCDTSNDGDPVVLYDSFEDRWVISDFAFQTNAGGVIDPPGVFQCFAVSKSGDPVSGGWNFYSINTTGGLGDYPKLGVWPDGIYMSVNLFNDALNAFFNPRLYALNKAQMYAGAPSVQVVTFDAPSAEFTILPANARLQTGTPPAGSPNYFAVVAQFLNAVSVYKFHVDWNSISTSTLTGPFISLTSTNWSQFTGANGDVPSPANNLDTLYPRLMVQNQYTNIGGVESLWDSHTVGASGTTSAQAAVRYYQVKVTGGTVEANATQAFTWSPDATVHRFMPSVAVDRAGDMALGYSASNASLNPAIRYAGRLAGDAANTISQTETSLIEGTGSQSGTCGPGTCVRWGDYSSMSLDPDGCTFWMSNEYYAVNGLNWQTRIGAFKYPSCTTIASGTVQGTVTATTGGAPISGATVSLGSRTTTTNGSGVYSFSGIPAGTYPILTASAAGFVTGSVSNLVVGSGGTTTQDFALATAPASACPVDTTQADFQKGIPTNVETTSTGDVTLLRPASIDQQNTSVTNSGPAFDSASWFGETFTAGATGLLSQVDVNLFCSGCTGTSPNITVSIRNTSSNLPTGADIATATILGTSSGSAAYLSAVFASPPAVTAGTQYAIVVRAVSNPSAGTYAYVVSSGNAYSAGRQVTSSNSGSTWVGTTTDIGFKTYVKTVFLTPGDLISSLKDSDPAVGLVPNWSTLSWTATTPANTLLRFQAAGSNSQFGPFNFVGPDGTAATFYTISGGSLGQFNGNRYLKYRAFLSTTNNAITPSLSDATVCYSNGVAANADLSISNSDGVTTATPGGSVSYTIAASNGGPSAAPGSNVSDTFPASLTCSWTCGGAGGGSCTASGSGNINDPVNLPSGGSVTYSANCSISPSATGSLANTASVAVPAGVIDSNTGNNTATDTDTLTPQANLTITNTDGVTTATPGGSVTYTITATNSSGPSAAPGSNVTDAFPGSLTCTWTCVGANGGTCTASGSGNINDTVNLPKTGSVTYTASCNISAAATGTLVNTATVATSATVTDPTPANNTATDTDTLTPQANLAITNTDGVTTATPGGSVTYTITATNTSGPSAAPGSNVSDTFPAALTCTWTCVGASGGTCTASGSGNINDTVNLPKTGSVTYTASCNISAAATGSLVNTATVATSATVTDPTPANNTATDTDTLSAQANLSITNTDGVTTATPGGSVTYTITASNSSGPSAAPGSNVTDTFPGSLTCTWTCVGASGGTCTASGSGNINDAVNLPKTGSVTYTASCNISAAATGSLVNTATVAPSATVTDPTPANNTATDTDTLSPQANLAITNTDGVTTATPGGSVTYTITATNSSGPSAAPGSNVSDAFPAALTCTWTCVGANGGTCTASGSGNINDTVNLPKTGSVIYTASCNISAAATGSLTNTATVATSATVIDSTPGNNTATDTDTLTPQADLGITKTDGVTTATPGGSVTYTITASNGAGPSAAPGSNVSDTFPAALTCTWTCVGASGGTCTASGSGNIIDAVNLPKTGSVTYTASCNISPSATGSLANTATVATSATVTDPTPANNTATDTDTLTPQANLAITNTDSVTTATPGGSVTYTITATNSSGPSAAPGSNVTDTFPASLTCTWTCVGASGGTCTASGSGNINDTVNLPKTGSVTYTASCNISAAATGSLVNTATVATSATVTDPTPGNNTATDTDTLSPQANLGITNTDGVTTATPGGSVTYTITATNTAGPSAAPGSNVSDTFPAALTCTWTCVGANGGTCTGSGSGNINDTVNLPKTGNVTYTASCTISASATGSLANTATVATSATVTDSTPGNNTATDADTLSPQADLGITNTDGATTATPGGSVTYTITATNSSGPSAAPGSNLTDTFPAALTCTWTCVGANGGTCTASGSGNINDTVNLPKTGSVTYTASCNITAAATGSLVNTATVATSATVTDPTPGNNSATDTDTLSPQANLGITNTDGVTSATPGGSVTYTITATNSSGPSAAPGSNVTDTFPASLTCTWTCVGASGGTCTASGSGNINDTVNLPKTGSVTYTASCNISIAATGSLVNTATVATSATVTDPTPGNNTATDTDTLAPQADLSITNNDGVTAATPGGSVTYTITAANAGPSPAPGSSVTDTFPAALTCTWTCVGSGSGTCTASGSGNINDTVGLPVGGSITYTASCTISPSATGSLSNTAMVAAPGGVTDPTPANNSATDTDTLSVQADLVLTISDSRSFAQVGDILDYVIEVTNPSGPSTAVAAVSDALPAELGAGAWTCTPSGSAACNNGSGNTLNDTATLPVGGKADYMFSAQVQSAGAADQIVNSASATLTSGSDPVLANNTASDTDTVVIFRDGFEGGQALVANVNAAGASFISAQLRVDPGLLGSLGIVPVEVANGRSADGKRLFTLQVARFGAQIALRTLTIDSRGASAMSEWRTVDLERHVLEFAWQSASERRNDGYFAAAAGGTPVLVDGRVEPARLTYLLIPVENGVPWLLLIEH